MTERERMLDARSQLIHLQTIDRVHRDAGQMSQTHYEDVKSRMHAAAEVVTRLLLDGHPNMARMHAETEWRPLHEEFTQLLREDTEDTA